LRFGPLKRGDVIVFKAPPNQEKDYIKRVIGVGGDSVMVKDGAVYVNNEKLDESAYLPADFKTYPGAFLQENTAVTVPANNYFVLGDNRNFSSDSREWGFIKKKDIVGQTLFVYWPPTKAKIIQNPLQ
jgi:signal peptidase I